MTYLDLINKVLRGLREPTVADLSATYTLHIGQLVNEVKEEIEDMGPWYALRTTVNKTLTPSTNNVALTTETNERSYLLYTKGMPMAFVVTVDEERRLDVVELGELEAIRALDPDAQEDVPYAVAFAKSNDGLTAHFFPTPDAAYDVRFIMCVPQDELSAAGTTITIPSRPVWQKALVLAMDERGEEFAGSIQRNEARAHQSLWDAVFADFGKDEMTFRAD